MASIAAQYLIDNEQDRSKYRRFNSKGEINGLVLVSREVLKIPTNISVLKKEENSTTFKPYSDSIENLKAEILIPHLSRKGKARFEKYFCFKEQHLNVSFEHVKHEDVKKYLAEGELFAIPKRGKTTKIIITGIPSEYSALDMLANIDRIIGFPDWQSEKPKTSF
jgi:hypothetical protein